MSEPNTAAPASTRQLLRRIGRVFSLEAGIIMSAISITALLIVSATLLARRDHDNALIEAQRENGNLALAFERHTAGVLRDLSALASAVERQYAAGRRNLDLSDAVETAGVEPQFVDHVLVTDANDVVRAASMAFTPVSLADREHVRVQHTAPRGYLYLGRPVHTRVGATWSMIATRRITRADGSYGGVVAIALDPGYFARFLVDLDLGTGGHIALVAQDGTLLARIPELAADADPQLQRTPGFGAVGSQAKGYFVARHPSSGKQYLYSFQRVQDWPLYVIIARAEDDVLAPARAHARVYFTAALLATLVVALSGWRLAVLAARGRRSRTALRASERRYRELVETVPQGVLALDANGAITYATPAAARVFGVDKHALIDKTLWDLARTHSHRDAVSTLFHEARTTGQSRAHFVLETRTLDEGRPIDVEVEWATQRDEHGAPRSFIAVAADVTALRETERRLAVASFAIEQFPEAALRVDARGRVLYANRNAYERFGYTTGELPGLTMERIDADFDRRKWQAFWERIRTERSAMIEQRHRRKDGAVFPVEMTVSYLSLPGGEEQAFAFVRDISQRRAAEDALRDREELLRQITEAVTDVFWVTDGHKKTLLYVSSGFERLTGRTVASLYRNPRSHLDTIHPDDLEAVIEALPQQPQGGYEAEYRVVHTNGSIHWVRERAFPIRDTSGRVYRIVGMAADITFRKSALTELQASREQLRLAIESAALVNWEWEPGTSRISWGHTAERLLGPVPQDQNGYPDVRQLIHADDRERVLAAVNNTVATGAPFETEFRIARTDGWVVWARASGKLIEGADGGASKLIGLMQDITQRKQAELALEASEALFRSLANLAPVGIALADLTGHRTYANRRWHELIGVASGGDLDTAWLTALHPEDRASALATRERAVRDNVDYANEYRLVRPDGDVVWIKGGAAVLREADGTPIGFIGVITDMTEHKRYESEIRSLNEALARRASALEITNRELESFSYSVSHDLRAPLRAIAGFSTILDSHVRDALDAQSRQYLDRIKAATHRMSQLIDALLELSRVTRAEIKESVVDLSALVRQRLAEITARDPDRRVDLKIEDGVRVRGDSRLLDAALTNLLENAWKFSARTPQARIEFGRVRCDDGTLACFVRDNGAGFDMAYADKLFGAFQRLHGEKEFSGTGIGLATVQRIVQRHGGRIWAEAAVGKGATFFFTLGER